jgi:hypothetical protein
MTHAKSSLQLRLGEILTDVRLLEEHVHPGVLMTEVKWIKRCSRAYSDGTKRVKGAAIKRVKGKSSRNQKFVQPLDLQIEKAGAGTKRRSVGRQWIPAAVASIAQLRLFGSKFRLVAFSCTVSSSRTSIKLAVNIYRVSLKGRRQAGISWCKERLLFARFRADLNQYEQYEWTTRAGLLEVSQSSVQEAGRRRNGGTGTT